MKPLTTSKVAQLAKLGVETLRFYERKGLIEQPPRTKSGYRQYPEEVIKRLRFIQRAQKLGFLLSEIKELLSLCSLQSAGHSDIRKQVELPCLSIVR